MANDTATVTQTVNSVTVEQPPQSSITVTETSGGALTLSETTGTLTAVNVAPLSSTLTIESEFAALNSPNFTGTPTAPTASPGTNTTQIATTAFVNSAVSLENSLSEMEDVNFASLGDNELLQYDSSSSKWKNQTIAEIGLATTSSLTAHTSATNNPHSVTATQVNLGNVTNESKTTMFSSPTFTGTPLAPTASAATNSTQIATTAYVTTAVSNLIDSAPAALDTLNELAAALNDDASFSTTVTNSIALKAPLASPALTGTPTAPTANAGTDTTQIATTAFVNAAVALENTLAEMDDVTLTSLADNELLQYNSSNSKWENKTISEVGLALASDLSTHIGATNPHNITASTVSLGNVTNESKATMFTSAALTGTPTAPTANAGTNTTQIATTAFVHAAVLLENSLAEMDDVMLSSVGDGELIVYNSGAWHNKTLTEAGILPLAGGTMTGALTVGVDDTGHDVKFFGATSGSYMQWDESADTLKLVASTIELGSAYAIQWGGAANRIWGSSGNNYIKIETNSTERVRVVSDGKVGIGTSSPARKLEVSEGSSSIVAQFKSTSGTSAFITLANTTATADQIRVGSIGNDLVLSTNYAERMRILSDGKVGIGTSSPASLLDVRGTVQVGVDDTGHDVKFFGATSGKYMLWDESDDILKFPDSTEINLGTGGDLRIYHDGTNNYIKSQNSADLYIHQGANDKDIIFECDDGSGGVETYFYLDGSASSGNPITRFPDDSRLTFGNSGDLKIYHNGTDSYISNNTGNLIIGTFDDDKDIIFKSDDGSGGTEVYFRLDGSASSGNPVTEFPDNSRLSIGTSQHGITLYHDGTDSFITNAIGDLTITNFSNDKDIIFQSDDGSGGTEVYFRLDGSVGGASPYTVFPDDSRLGFGNVGDGSYMHLLHDATNSYIENKHGHLFISNYADDKDIIFQSDDGSGGLATYFYLDGSSGYTKFSEDIKLLDSVNLRLGVGNDLYLYHDGSNSHIKSTTSDLYIQNDADDKDIIFQCDDGSGGMETYFRLDGSASSGNPITNFPDNSFLSFGSSHDFSIYHDSTNTYIANSTNDLYIQNNANDKDIIFRSDDGSGSVETYFYLDGSLNSGNYPITVFPDDSSLCFGDGRDLVIAHNGTDTNINNYVGHLNIINRADGKDIVFYSDDGSGDVAEYFRLDGALSHSVVSKHIRFGDNVIARFGDGNDASLYHTGTNTIFENTNGDLYIKNHADDKDIIFQSDDGSGSVTTYFRLDGSFGGAGYPTTLFPQNSSLRFGNSGNLQIINNGTDSYIQENNGDLYIRQSTDDKDIIFQSDDGSGSVTNYIQIDGGNTLTYFAKPTKHADSTLAGFGTDNDLRISHNATNSLVENITGDLQFIQYADDKMIRFYNDNGSGGTIEYIRVDGSEERTVFSKDARLLDDIKLNFGASSDLKIYHDGTHSYIDNSSTFLILESDNIILRNNAGDEDYAKFLGDGAVELYHNDVKKFETTAAGATVTGNLTVSADLIINGTTTTVNSTTVTIDDPVFTLGGDSAPSSDDNKDRGIEFRYHNGSAAKIGFFGWDDSASVFTFIADASPLSEVYSGSAGNVAFGNIAGTLTTAAQGNITSLGTLTTLTVDDITINGSTISDAGDLTIDVGGDIILDADGGDVLIKDGGTQIGQISKDISSSNFVIKSSVSDADLEFKGVDGGANITALLIDMSEGGDIVARDNKKFKGTTYSSSYIKFEDDTKVSANSDIIFDVNGSTELMRLEEGGNVGIGTSSPDRQLEIYGSNDGYLKLDGGRSGNHGFSVGSDLYGFGVYDDTLSTYRLVIDQDSGNVGLGGTTNPLSTLHVATNDATNGDLMIGGNNDPMGFACEFVGNNDTKLHIGRKHSADSEFIERVTILDDGKVGIGTTSPARHLHINGGGTNVLANFESTDAGAYLSFSDDSTTNDTSVRLGANGNNFQIFTNGQERIRLKSTGEVGIGTTSPASLLDVRGTVQVGVDDTGHDVKFYGATSGTYFHWDESADKLILNEASLQIIDATPNIQLYDSDTTNQFNIDFDGADVTFKAATTDGDIIFQADNGSGGLDSYFRVDGGDHRTHFFKQTRHYDNIAAKFGASDDLSLYHSGSHSYISNNTGNLYITNYADDQDILFGTDDGSGSTETYFYLDGSASSGNPITVFPDNSILQIGGDFDLRISHDGTDSTINNYTGDLIIKNSSDDKDIIFQSDDGSGGTETYFYLDGSVSSGSPFTIFPTEARCAWGNSAELQITHTGTDSYIANYTGHLYVNNDANDKDIIFQCDDGSGGLETYFYLDGSVSSGNPFTVFPDNSRLCFGTNLDLRFVHDGSNSYISQTGTGDLYIQNGVDDRDIVFQSDDGSGGIETYFYLDGSLSSGEPNTVFPDNSHLRFGTDADLDFVHDGSNAYINNSTGDLYITNNANDKDVIFRSDDGSGGNETYFFLDGSASSGNPFTVFPDNSILQFGTDIDLYIYSDGGSNSYIKNSNGHLQFIQYANDKDIIFQCDDGSGGVAEYFRLDGGLGYLFVSKTLNFADNVPATFGPAGDLNIRHDGTDSSITNNTGDLYVRNTADDKDIIFKADAGGTEAEIMRIDGSTGRVGIGTSSPQEKFHVDEGYILADGASTNHGFELRRDSYDTFQIRHLGGNFTINNLTDNRKDLCIDGSGNVGIGTTSPNYLLDVEKSGAGMRVYNTDNNGQTDIHIRTAGTTGSSRIFFGDTDDSDVGSIIYRHNGDSLAFETGDSERMRLNSTGLGIGTTSPSEKLHVSGNARIGNNTTNGHLIGRKDYSVTQTFSTGLTVELGNHKACHVKVFISGDWSNHSSFAYVGEFFIQNGGDGYNEPGIILTEHDNLPTDGILSQIVDGTSDSFEIQFRANTSSATSVSGRLCYHVMGDATSVS